jgi:hypothetical protein
MEPNANNVNNQGVQDQTPVATMGFGAREDADSARQAQHMAANDTPVDVNFNAAVARSQVLTVDALGKSFVANQDFREKIQDRFLASVK